MAFLEANEITISLRSSLHASAIVDAVSLRVERGEVLGIVGESGSGKSLTALSLLGLTSQNLKVSGRMIFDGHEFNMANTQEIVPLRGLRFGMIFQDPRLSLNPVRTIGSHFRELAKSGSPIRSLAADALTAVGVSDPHRRLKQYPHQLSGGLCQRIMIALALFTAPDVLIADEPTTALDTTVQAQVLDLIDAIRSERKMSVIMISHDLAVISEISDRIAVMRNGRVVEQGGLKNVFDKPKHDYTRQLVDLVMNTTPFSTQTT